ncbi:unnamed protein product [Orchesella dallaii]|uniref:Lipase domain-containing protein n=1 Tax=Orchesella dallaii TaxID=48710 RepID=A0ABP1PYU8_9HEXA
MLRFQYSMAFMAIGFLVFVSEVTPSNVRFLMRDRLNDEFPEFPADGIIPDSIAWHIISGLKVVVSDYSTASKKDLLQNLKDQNIIYLAKSMCKFNLTNNIIIADLAPMASKDVSQFSDVVGAVHNAGKELADHLISMRKKQYFSSWKLVSIFGVGIGAHVGAVAAQILQQEVQEKIEGLTGLDPFGPGFVEGNKYKQDAISITKDDADFVKVLHCNMGNAETLDDAIKQGRYGSSIGSAHVHIFANGGEQMPTCKQEDETPDKLCSHRKCAAFFANSIRQPVPPIACPCDSWESFKAGKCICTKENGGIDVSYLTSPRATGKFYAEVPEELLIVK